MLTGELSGFDSMISPMYFHQRCITGSLGRSSNFMADEILSTPNKERVSLSRKMLYSLMPVSFNRLTSSGQISSWRFRYSSWKPGNNFILNATLSILSQKCCCNTTIHIDHITCRLIQQSTSNCKTSIGNIFWQNNFIEQSTLCIVSR